MDPFTIMLGLGAGLKAFGLLESHSASKQANAAQVQSIQLQQQVEDQRRKAMEIDASRKQLENIRNAQRGRSMALAAATSQGAQFGSSLQGGYGQISGQEGWNSTGIDQQLDIGRNVFGLNAQISQQKVTQARAGQKMQDAQGISSLGGDIMGSINTLNKITSPLPGNSGSGGSGISSLGGNGSWFGGLTGGSSFGMTSLIPGVSSPWG